MQKFLAVIALCAALTSSFVLTTAVFNPDWTAAVSPLVINEFMASNGQTLADEDGDFPDWIELYNPGATAVSLAGYALSDDPHRPMRWLFPDVAIPPGAYLLVWASGKNRASPDSPLHTNFSISAAGEPLLLTHATYGVVDQVAPVAVPRDMSYGRQPDGASQWHYFNQPTPGGPNHTFGYTDLLPPPRFSHTAGFYPHGFLLTLATDHPDATIIFTLDGSIPDPQNLNGQTYYYKNQYPQDPGDPVGPFLTDSYQSFLYSQPILIQDRTGDPDKLTGKSSTYSRAPHYFPQSPMFKGTVVRAQVVKEGALPSAIQTHTFFVTPEMGARYSLPVVSLSVAEEALFDYRHGLYVAGYRFDTWRLQNPDTPAHTWASANWHARGDGTESAAYIEFFEDDGTVVLRQDVGLRLHGGATRAFRMKSLRLYARSQYGESSFDYSFFPDLPYESYRRIVLRNAGNDFHVAMMRDAAIQTWVEPLLFDTQAYRPVIVFINGEYWGVHSLRERYDRHYLARVYNLGEGEVDLLQIPSSVIEGDAIHYSLTLSYIAEHGLQSEAAYDYIQTRIDLENYRDYQIAQIYVGNMDWLDNNIRYWRLRTDGYELDAPYGADGRWRWLMFDTDFSLGLLDGPEFNNLDRASRSSATPPPLPPPGNLNYFAYLPIIYKSTFVVDSTFLFRELLENENFKLDFINRFADLMNTIFLPEHAEAVFRELQQAAQPEMEEHIMRWRAPASLSVWQGSVEMMIAYAYARPDYQRQHIRERFAIPGDYLLTVAVSDPIGGYVRVNTIDLLPGVPGVAPAPYPWTGVYFQGIPIKLEAVAAPGYQFVGWEGMPAGTLARSRQSFAEDTAVTALFAPSPGGFNEAGAISRSGD